MILLETTGYVIKEYNGLPKKISIDRKELSNGRICLVNVGWEDTLEQAVKRMNQDLTQRP